MFTPQHKEAQRALNNFYLDLLDHIVFEKTPTFNIGEKKMNNRNMAMSLMDNIGTASVVFESVIKVDIDEAETLKHYTYCYNKSAFDLKAGNRVVIRGSGEFKVGTVVDVHEYNKMDMSASFGYVLIDDVIDSNVNNEVNERIDQAIRLLNETKRNETKHAMLKTFTENMDDESKSRLTDGFKSIGITFET